MKGPAIKPSDTIRREYQAALQAYVRRMNEELMREVTRAYARREDEFLPEEMAEDASAAVWLGRVLNRFFGRWQEKFDTMAEKRAKWFADRTEKASSKQIQAMLKNIGFTVEFKNSHYVNNIMQATYAENVSLIKSIPKQMHGKALGIVTRGVQAGNDQHFISVELEKEFNISQRRARFVARDQTQKANSSMAMARSAEAGIEYGFWLHRSGSKKPRWSHSKPEPNGMNGVRFKLSEGLHDPDPKVNRKVKPGELPGCLCAYRPDLSSFRPQMAQDSAVIRPCKVTYANIMGRVANSTKEAA